VVEDRIGRTGDRMADEHHYDPSLYAVTPRLVISLLSVPWTSLYPFIRESSLERLSLLAISNFIHPPKLFSSSFLRNTSVDRIATALFLHSRDDI
jgi:hypothetical protein